MNIALLFIFGVSTFVLCVLIVWYVIELFVHHFNIQKMLLAGITTTLVLSVITGSGAIAINYFYKPNVFVEMETKKEVASDITVGIRREILYTEYCAVKIDSSYPLMLFMEDTIKLRFEKICGDLTADDEKRIEFFRSKLASPAL